MSLFQINRILFLVAFIFKLIVGVAQEKIDPAEVEQKSFQLYSEAKWTELIKYGSEAIDQGFNYYYMQMRVGIAYYEKKNYLLAEPFFKAALKLNSGDELVQEYLYYCYFLTGRTDEARKLSRSFSAELLTKLNAKGPYSIGYIFAEGGTKITDSTSYYDVGRKKSSNYFDPAVYAHLGLEHTINRQFSLIHALTYFSQNNFIGNLRQMQYYLKANIPIKNNWSVSPAFHFINVNFASQYTVYPTPSFPPRPPGPATIITSESSSNYIVASLAVDKRFKRFQVSLINTYSNMSDQTQLLHGSLISYSPFGNSKLVIGCTGYIHSNDSYSTIYTSATPFVFYQPIGVLSLKAALLYNTGSNIIEENGYFVNNSPDLTRLRYSLTANITINKHLDLFGVYQLEFKNESVQKFNYQYNIIVGGIKIRP